MSRMVLKLAGLALAVWLVFSVIGTVLSMIKLFVMVGLCAVAVMLAVALLTKSSRT